jgi:hypothetical protein
MVQPALPNPFDGFLVADAGRAGTSFDDSIDRILDGPQAPRHGDRKRDEKAARAWGGFGQGFHFSRPMPAVAAQQFLLDVDRSEPARAALTPRTRRQSVSAPDRFDPGIQARAGCSE